MLEQCLAWLRGWRADRVKAHQYLTAQAEASFHRLTAEYDAFLEEMQQVSEPALLIGTAYDADGHERLLRVSLPHSTGHCLNIGATGTGKSSAELVQLPTYLRSHGMFPAGVADFKEGLFDETLRWYAAIAHTLAPSEQDAFLTGLVVFNPFAERLMPFNVCRRMPHIAPESQSYEVVTALSRLFEGFSTTMESIMQYLVTLLIESDLTLVEAPLLLEDEVLLGILVTRSTNPRLKDFFLRTFPEMPSISKHALMSRLQSLLLPPSLYLMLGADAMLDVTAVLEQGHTLVAFLGKGPGMPEALVETLGSLFLQVLFNGAFARASRPRRPYRLICDEFFHLLDAPGLAKRFETALVSLRSYGVFLTLIMHQFSQVPPNLRETLLGNVDMVRLFRTSERNAQYLGEVLPPLDPERIRRSLAETGEPPSRHEMRQHLIERLQRLPNRHCFFYDRRKPYGALLVRVPDVPQPHEAIGISEGALESFMAAHSLFTGAQALPRETLQGQIVARRQRLEHLVRPQIEVHTPTATPPPPPKAQRGRPDITRKPRIG